MHFGIGKSRDVTWRDVSRLSVVQYGATSATGATRTTHVQERRHSVDWGEHVHFTFSRRNCSWDWFKSRTRKTNLEHVSTTASSSSAMLEQAHLDTLVTTRLTRSTCRICRVVSRRDVMSQVEFGLYNGSRHSTKQGNNPNNNVAVANDYSSGFNQVP